MIEAVKKNVNDIVILCCICLVSTLLVWLPFSLHLKSFYGIPLPDGGFQTVQRNYDGLNYVIVAKSWYQKELIGEFPQNLPAEYFAAHFPGFPFAIKLFSAFGYLESMLLVTVLFSIVAVVAFYLLLRELGVTNDLVWLSTVFLLLPARWLVVRSVGAPESMFIAFVLLSFLFFLKALKSNAAGHFFYAGLFGALAMLTKSPGILLFIAYGPYLLWDSIRGHQHIVVDETTYSSSEGEVRVEKLEVISSRLRSNNNLSDFIRSFRWNAYPLLLIPLGLLGVFYLYSRQYGDFFAYFHSGDNIHLTFPPFQVFNSSQYWVGSFWLEDIIFYVLMYGLAFFTLWQKRLYPPAIFVGVFLLATISVAHRDVARYSLPMAPFAIIAFQEFLSTKIFKYTMVLLILAIYLYAVNFIAGNTFPVTNLGPYL